MISNNNYSGYHLYRVREVFLSSPTELCKLKFCELLGSRDMQVVIKLANMILNHIVISYDMQEATDAVLDTLIEKIPLSKNAIKVHYSLLEANDNGVVQLGNFHQRSTFKYIVNTDNKVCMLFF